MMPGFEEASGLLQDCASAQLPDPFEVLCWRKSFAAKWEIPGLGEDLAIFWDLDKAYSCGFYLRQMELEKSPRDKSVEWLRWAINHPWQSKIGGCEVPESTLLVASFYFKAPMDKLRPLYTRAAVQREAEHKARRENISLKRALQHTSRRLEPGCHLWIEPHEIA